MDDPTLPTPPAGLPVSRGSPTHNPSIEKDRGQSPPESDQDPPAVSSSLDTTETSEISHVKAFLEAKPEPSINPLGPWESTAVRFRHAGWRPIRDRVYGSLVRTGQSSSRITSFACCGAGTYLQRRETKLGVMEYRLKASCCHDRLCTPCAAVRSWKLQLALRQVMAGKRMTFITLTLAGKNESLAEKIDRLYKSFRALRNHPLWSERIRGGAAFLEVKHSAKAERWHPHLHIMADAGYIDQGELSTVWRTITRDSFIVDIRRVKDEGQAASYVTKYASKPLNTSFSNDPILLDEAVEALKGRRLCFAFGDWYGNALDIDSDSLLDEGEENDNSWENFMPLDMLIEQCNSGDRESMSILRAAGAETQWRLSLSG